MKPVLCTSIVRNAFRKSDFVVAALDREKRELLEEVGQIKKTKAMGEIKIAMLERELEKVQEPHIRRLFVHL